MQDGMADVDENEDLLDALAVCMDVGDEKFAYYPKDFASVMMSLPGSDSRRKLDWMMTWKDLETLIRLLVSIAGHWYDLNHGVHAAALKGNEQVLDRILSTFRLYGNGSEYGLSWSAFCTTAESHLVPCLRMHTPNGSMTDRMIAESGQQPECLSVQHLCFPYQQEAIQENETNISGEEDDTDPNPNHSI